MRRRPKPPTTSEMRKSIIEEASKLILVAARLSWDGGPHFQPVLIRAMVDTGAMATLVRLSAIKGRMPYRRPPKEMIIVRKGLDSLVGPLRIFGAFKCLLRAEGGPELPMTVGIIDFSRIPHLRLIGADMILGLDYLSLSAATVDVSAGVVRYGIESAPFRQTASRRLMPLNGSGPLPPAQGLPGGPEHPHPGGVLI